MEILLQFAIFSVSLFTLVKGSDFFIASVEKIGLKFGISEYILGITVVALGTSLPELASSIAAVYEGEPDIVLGNVVGSNITNILLVVGTLAIVSKTRIRLSRNLLTIDIPFLFISAVFLYFSAFDKEFSTTELIVFGIGMIVFVWSSLGREGNEERNNEIQLSYVDILKLIAGALMVYFGSVYTIEGISQLANSFGVGSGLIAITLVALGTSLPELVVSLTAIKRGNAEMGVGNILGSNIFNTYGVVAITSLFGTVTITEQITSFGIPFMLAVTLIFGIMSISRTLTRTEGILLIMMYVFFIDQAV